MKLRHPLFGKVCTFYIIFVGYPDMLALGVMKRQTVAKFAVALSNVKVSDFKT